MSKNTSPARTGAERRGKFQSHSIRYVRKNSNRYVRKLRNADTDLSLPLRKTNNGQKAISFRGPRLWNQLELDAKQAPSLATFTRIIKDKL